jgi:hypothetical protein
MLSVEFYLIFFQSVNMLSAIMLNAAMLSVVEPILKLQFLFRGPEIKI